MDQIGQVNVLMRFLNNLAFLPILFPDINNMLTFLNKLMFSDDSAWFHTQEFADFYFGD